MELRVACGILHLTAVLSCAAFTLPLPAFAQVLCGPMGDITVGSPVAYDTAALEQALQGTLDTLEKRTSVLSLGDIIEALGTVQGSSLNQTYRTLGVNIQLPTTSLLSTLTTSGAPSSDNKPPTTTLESVRKTEQAAPTVPTLAAPSEVAVPSVGAGALSARDLLAEQLELDFQLTNLRMMLDRLMSRPILVRGEEAALGDRLVVGFPVTVNPGRSDAVAEVQFMLKSTAGAPQPILMLPEATTYNVSMVTTDANQTTLGAVAQFLGISGASGRRNADMYLVRDTDTVGLLGSSHPPSRSGTDCAFRNRLRQKERDPDSLVLGWQFRPVLGSHTVAPGTRWVYAVLQLPNSKDQWYRASVRVRTCWRSYDHRTRTVGDELPGTAEGRWLPCITVDNRPGHKDALRPTIRDVTVRHVGGDQYSVTINSSDLMPGTRVLLGTRQITESDGLTRLGRTGLRFVASLKELAFSEPLLVDRYGRSRGCSHQLEAAEAVPVRFNSVTVTPRSTTECTVELCDPEAIGTANGDGKPTVLHGCLDWSPLVAIIGDRAILPLGAAPVPENSDKVSFSADTELLRANREVRLRRLGTGSGFDAVASIPAEPLFDGDFTVEKVYRAGGTGGPAEEDKGAASGPDTTRLHVVGQGFRKGNGESLRLVAIVDGTEASEVKVNSATLLTVTAKAPKAGTLVLFVDGNPPVTCAIPKGVDATEPTAAAPPVSGLRIVAPKAGVYQDDAVCVELRGSEDDLGLLASPETRILYGASEIPFFRTEKRSGDKTETTWWLSVASPLTDKPRTAQFTVQSAGKTMAPPGLCIEVKARPGAGGGSAPAAKPSE